MKYQKRRSIELEFVDDPGFADACNGDSQRLSSRRQVQRKTQQFCRQVQRALNLALQAPDAAEPISGLFVEEVSPAPDCGRLLVHVLIPDGRPLSDALAALHRETPRLRSEVAASITRKRAPELFFVPLPAFGGDDE